MEESHSFDFDTLQCNEPLGVRPLLKLLSLPLAVFLPTLDKEGGIIDPLLLVRVGADGDLQNGGFIGQDSGPLFLVLLMGAT